MVMAGASTVMSTVGQIQQGQAQKAAGEAQAAAAAHRAALAESQAKSMEIQAGQERAVSQRAAMAERKKERLVSSRVSAISAASGAGALDPTIINILGDIATEGESNALTALFEGEERARGLEIGAGITRAGGQGELFAGEVAKRAGVAARNRSFLSAGGTILSGGSSLFEKYARTRPQQATAPDPNFGFG